MPKQLSFALPHKEIETVDDFYVTQANETAFRALERDFRTHKMILRGPAGSGKTHLAKIWAHRVGAHIISAREITKVDIGAINPGFIVLEDIDKAEGLAFETAAFHLHNQIATPEGGLLLTATKPLPDWNIHLEDLKSRLLASEQTSLNHPDEPLLIAVLTKAFYDRQLAPPANVLNYLAHRIERSLLAATEIVAKLDARAMETGRPITRGLVRDCMK